MDRPPDDDSADGAEPDSLAEEPDLPPADQDSSVSLPPPAEEKRPGIGAGVGTGCLFQVLASLLFLAMLGASPLVGLWPFILITVGSAILLFFKRWRRFGTGALIVSVAAWIVFIGPCVYSLNQYGQI